MKRLPQHSPIHPPCCARYSPREVGLSWKKETLTSLRCMRIGKIGGASDWPRFKSPNKRLSPLSTPQISSSSPLTDSCWSCPFHHSPFMDKSTAKRSVENELSQTTSFQRLTLVPSVQAIRLCVFRKFVTTHSAFNFHPTSPWHLNHASPARNHWKSLASPAVAPGPMRFSRWHHLPRRYQRPTPPRFKRSGNLS